MYILIKYFTSGIGFSIELLSINYYSFKPQPMLRWTITFLVIALIAALLGFGGIAAGAAGIAKILFFVFLVLFILSLLFGKSFGRSDV